MTPEERQSLQPECVKGAPSQNLLGAGREGTGGTTPLRAGVTQA